MRAVIVLLALVCLTSVAAFRGSSSRLSTRTFNMKLQDQGGEKLDGFNSVAAKLKAKFVPALLGAGLMLAGTGGPDVAEAARGGGRSGGASFRGGGGGGYRPSSAMRSSSRGYSGGGYRGGVSMMPPIMPMYSPFGYGGFGMGFMPINFNVIALGLVAYVVFNALSNRVGGSDFSDDGMGTSSLGSGATVMKLQIAMSSDWAEENNVMETLTLLANRNSAMSSRSDLARLLSESSLALLRRTNDWEAAAYEGDKFMLGPQKAEPYFQRLAIGERSKFEKETNGDVAMIKPTNDMSTSQPTEVVVSLVVAMKGQSSAYSNSVRSLAEVKTCLQGLAADALTDEGDNVMAVELLWTPSERGSTISKRELINDYPELINF